jgi:hypothetical protein
MIADRKFLDLTGWRLANFFSPIFPPLPAFLRVSKVFLSLIKVRYCRGGVFLTVITTSHAPFAMNNKIAGKKYLLTGT